VFWKSIIEGFTILGQWEVWLAAVLYLAVNFAFLMVVAKMIGEEELGWRIGAVWLFHMIGGTILHGILMGLTIAFLLPILLGGASAAPISAIGALLWPLIKIGVIAIIAVTILSFIPVIGAFIAHSPGIQAFLEGLIIFRFLSGYAIEQILAEAGIQGSVYPGFWACIGFLIIAGVLVRLIMLGAAFVCLLFEDTLAGEVIPVFGGLVLGVLGGMIPLFMYSSYVQLSLVQLIGG
jgi:hypothetical protein